MAENTNGAVSRNIADAFKVQEAGGLPKQIANALSPVVDVGANHLKFGDKSFFGTRTTTGTSTITTLDADKPFFLTNAMMFIQCDAAADSTDYSMRVVINGEALRIVQIQKITLTATSQLVSLTFPTPLKLDAGSTITMVQAFTLGVSVISGTVQGYFEK